MSEAVCLFQIILIGGRQMDLSGPSIDVKLKERKKDKFNFCFWHWANLIGTLQKKKLKLWRLHKIEDSME